VPINFHVADIDFRLDDANLYSKWVEATVNGYHKKVGELSIIFSSNSYLLDLNRKFLNHNYFTDVITFNYNEGGIISGDIFVSAEQVEYNAGELDIDFESEICRVMIHGVLHLLGLNDDNDRQRKEMRSAENNALTRLSELRNGKGV